MWCFGVIHGMSGGRGMGSEDIYEEFVRKVREKCRLVETVPSIVGSKSIYECRNYLVVLDNMPFSEEDKVVSIADKRRKQMIYLSPSSIRGMFRVQGIESPEYFIRKAKEEGKQILKKIIKEIDD